MHHEFVFIITSTIATTSGCFSPEVRMQQTFDTINSIKDKCPGAYIILIDNSPIDERPAEVLRHAVNVYQNVSARYSVAQLMSQMNINGIKGYGDFYMTQIGLQHARKIKCRRIFKISGRYLLDKEFNIDQYRNDDMNGKYVFKVYYDEPMNNNVLITRFWSLCPSLIDECLGKLRESLVKMLSESITIETALYRTITDKIFFVDNLNLKGTLASCNLEIKD